MGLVPALACCVTPGRSLSLSGPGHFRVKTAVNHVKGFLKGWGWGEVHTKGIAAFSQQARAYIHSHTWTCTLKAMFIDTPHVPTFHHGSLIQIIHKYTCNIHTHACRHVHTQIQPSSAVVPVEPRGLSSCFSVSTEEKPGVSLLQGVHPDHPGNQRT